MKEQIIQAIKDFNISKLNAFLDDSNSYMDVSKSLFLEALEGKFNEAKEQACNGFDEVGYGICGKSNKGCEVVTFLSKSGVFLDLFIESENNIDVNDIYTCNNTISSRQEERRYNLNFRFYEDEKVYFQPNSDYKFVEERYKLMLSDINGFKEDLKREDFITWYDQYNDLRNLDFLEIALLKLYTKIYDVIRSIDKILEQEIEAKDFVKSIKEEASV